MTPHNYPETQMPETQASPPPAGVSRRPLVRAGLTAAPVMAALKSNTVLAGEHSCIRPSSFSSLAAAHMKLSKGRTVKTDYACKSHGHWKNQPIGWNNEFKKKRFLNSKLTTTGFTANPGSVFSKKTFQEVLDMGGNDRATALARHVVAAYLSAVSVNDHPDHVWLTKAQCNAIWNGQGVWKPFAGSPTWTLQRTMDYFDMILGPAFLPPSA
jgi:hypothetical protein